MEIELGTTANKNMYYINTAQITFIHFEFRNLTNPQEKHSCKYLGLSYYKVNR